jgi:hypothetical protein
MRLFDSGYGDYTRDRRAWFKDLTVEQIYREIQEMKKNKQS